jgi:hypothetical protein
MNVSPMWTSFFHFKPPAAGSSITLSHPPKFCVSELGHSPPQVSGLIATSSKSEFKIMFVYNHHNNRKCCFRQSIRDNNVTRAEEWPYHLGQLYRDHSDNQCGCFAQCWPEFGRILQCRPSLISFFIDKSLRVSGKVAPCTISFPLVSSISTGHEITIIYPRVFFNTDSSIPFIRVDDFVATGFKTSEFDVACRISSGFVPANSAVTVTLGSDDGSCYCWLFKRHSHFN